ncbi:MAG: hypothetical protein ACLUS6_09285 [Dysosmobacter sp.]
MKKVFSLILALGLIASLTACGGGNASGNETGDSAPTASTAKLRFVTGGESGTYYAFGSVIAQHATNNTDVSVTGLVGNGSKSNVEELARRQRGAGLLPVRRNGLCLQRHQPL